MGFTLVGEEAVTIRFSSNGLLTLNHAKHDVDPLTPIIIAPESVDEVEPGILAPAKLCPLTAAYKADTMSTGDEEQSLGLNGRLRPRKSLVASPPITKVSRKSDGRSPSGRPKRNTSTSNASPSKIDDLFNKSDSPSTPQLLCPYCDKKFASKQNVIKHVRRLHMFDTKQEPTVSCLFCNHSEADFDIIRHMVDSHPNQYFACLDCHSRFNSTAELAEHKLGVCEKQKPNYKTKPRQKNGNKKHRNPLKIGVNEEFRDDCHEYSTGHGFNGIVISCELKPSQVSDDADIEDNITTNLILPHSKSLGANAVIEKNAVIVLDDLQWNKRIPPNFSFQNTDADQILSRLGVVHRSPRTADASRRDWYKLDDSMQKFEKCFDTSFYSKVASNVHENLSKFLDGSFNFNPDPDSMIKTRKSKNSVVINTAEGFPILLACEQFSRNVFDGYMPRAIAPKHKWKWENQENDRSAMNPDQIKRDAHTNNCIITLISSLDIWTQLSMRKKFEDKFNISPPEKKTEKQQTLGKELKEILESRELPAASSPPVKYPSKPSTSVDMNDFPASLGLQRAEKPVEIKPAALSGEWVRPRCYVCCACGAQAQDSKALSSHITTQHPNAQVQHYEIVGELLLNADILKHLYVPPSQTVNRTRPLRGIRDCTKCKKSISLEDLHQHMLDCAGDTPAVRRKGRHHRPFGVRRRRPRLPDNTIRKKIRKEIRGRQIRPKTRIRSRPKIRSEVGDAETIRKMLADLPPKRHRSSVTNQMLRPPKRSNIQINKFLIKRRSSEEQKSRRLRSSRRANTANQPSTSVGNDKYLDPDDEDNKPLKPRAITNKTTLANEHVNRNTKINRAKRKSLRNTVNSNADVATLSNALSTSSDKPTEMLSPGQSPQKIDVNNSPYNTRDHANRGGNNNRGDQRAGGSGRNDNPNNAAPAPNTPLKHSIARLTAESERHDKSVQFHHLFLVQQEYNHVNSTVQHGHAQQPVFFENEAAVTKLDKPPLQEAHKSVANLQKCKLSKPKKGLNDCIAMLKNKLVDPIPSATHVSVQCGSDEPIDDYVNEQIAPITSSTIYEKPNGMVEPTFKNLNKPIDTPSISPTVDALPAVSPPAKSLRNERSLRYHRKSLPEREVLTKPKRSTRRTTISEIKLLKQNTSEPDKLEISVLPKPSKVMPNETLETRLNSSLEIIPLPVTYKNLSTDLNTDSGKVKTDEVKRGNEQTNVNKEISVKTNPGPLLDSKQVTCSKNSVEVASKTLQQVATEKCSDQSEDQCIAKEVQLTLAISPIPPVRVTDYVKIPTEIPQAHSNANVESIVAVPLDLSGKVSKIKLVQIPNTQAFVSDDNSENGTLDLSKKNMDITRTDVIVDLRKIPANNDQRNTPQLSMGGNDYNDEITDLSCNKSVYLHTPTDLSVRGKNQLRASPNKMKDYETLPKIASYLVPTPQTEKPKETISNRPAEFNRSNTYERSTSRINTDKEFLRHKPTPIIEPNKDTAANSATQPEMNNSDLPIIVVTDLSTPKQGTGEVKHINHMIKSHNETNLTESDNHGRDILRESHDSLNKCTASKILAPTSPDSKQLKIKSQESRRKSESNLAAAAADSSEKLISDQKLAIQSGIVDFTAKTKYSVTESANEVINIHDENNYLAGNLQKPVYDPTLKIPQYKIRITTNNTSSSIHTTDILNYAPGLPNTSLSNDSQSRLIENLPGLRAKSLQESTLLTSHYTPGDRGLYGFANGPMNSLGSLPSYTIHNRTMGASATKQESTKPVYTLANACISVTKIDPSSSATLTNTLLSIPGSTIASTMPVYTLTGTTIGAQMEYSNVSGQSSEINPETAHTFPSANNTVSRDISGVDDQVTSPNVNAAGNEYRKNVETSTESKPVSNNNASIKPDHDPETARKIAMLPKELVDILGTMPIDHRNQLLNVLPQYVSTLPTSTNAPTDSQTDTVSSVSKISSSPNQAVCPRKSFVSESSIANPANRQPATFNEHPSSNLPYQNPVSYSEEKLENNEHQNKLTFKDLNMSKIIDLTEEDSLHSTPGGLKPIEDLSGTILSSTPQQNIDQESIKIMQKGSNDKTSSLRAVRIKPQIERNKSMSIFTHPPIPDIIDKPIAEVTNTTLTSNSSCFTTLAIQQAEVTSTQHKNNLKLNNETVNITPPPTTSSPAPNDDTHLLGNQKICENMILKNVSVGDIDVVKGDDRSAPTEQSPLNELVIENVPIVAKHTEANDEIQKTEKSESDSDDDISLAAIVKQKQDQKDSKPETHKKKSVVKNTKKKKEKKLKNETTINVIPLSKVKQSLQQGELKVIDEKNLEESINIKSPDSNNEDKSMHVFENLKVNNEQCDKITKRKKTRRNITTATKNCETLQDHKSVQYELDINKENKVCEGQQNSKSNEIHVCEDTKKENQPDQDCKKAILRTDNDKNDNELDGNKNKINRDDKTHLPVDISPTSNIKVSEECINPNDAKNNKQKPKITGVSSYKSEELKQNCVEKTLNNKSISMNVKENQQTEENQEKTTILNFPNSKISGTDIQETNKISKSDEDSGYFSTLKADNVAINHDSQVNTSIPLRRSRRGKSLVDLSYYQDGEDAEQNIPITKKQLIFTKLLQDEENIVKNTSSQDDESLKSAISDDRPSSPITHESQTIDDNVTKQNFAKLDKIKPIKRKQSPQVKRKSKKKKSTDTVDSLDEIAIDTPEGTQRILDNPLVESHPQSTKCLRDVSLSTDAIKSVTAIMETINNNCSILKSPDTSRNSISPLDSENGTTLSAEKRKLTDNATSFSTSQISKPKKIKFSENIEPFDINKDENDYGVNEPDVPVIPENRTACYNMPVASRRTRSKSVVVSTTSEPYDPYDIDQDEMIDIAEPIKNTHHSNKNSKCKTHEKSKNKHVKRFKKSYAISSATINVQKSETVCTSPIPKMNIQIKKHFRDEEMDSDDSSKSDVPLKQLVKEKENKLLATNKDNVDTNLENSTDKQNEHEINIKQSQSVHNDEENEQIETDKQLRSEQFMESFGFFSERKPRKSNLLASKKISETFHIIANENDDVYFGLKEKAIKKSLHESIKKSNDAVNDDNIPKKAAKRGRKKKSSSKPSTCYCYTCKKEFRRPDNYLRHQMTLLHVSKLSELEFKFNTIPVPEDPNYLIAFKQHIDKLDILSRDKKHLKSRSKIIMPTLNEILADVNKTVRDQQLSKRGLSNDEALFLDCCELLKESHNPDYINQETASTANASDNITSESQPASRSVSSNLDMLCKTFPSYKVDAKSDGDVDSITAKNILESEEVRNLENDLISGLKEAASASHNYHCTAVGSSTTEGNNDVFSSPNGTDSHFEHIDDLDDIDNATPKNDDFDDYPVYKEKMYPDIEEIDMFEDKFDKIKRKCRSSAAAANKTQVTVEPSASIKVRRKSKSEKKKAKKSSKKIHKSMIPTKAALKGFDGIKVSIPTSDINMSAIVPAETTGKKKKKTDSKKKRNKFNSESSSKADSDHRTKTASLSQAQNPDVYEFMDNEDAELFELRPSTLMERFKRDKDTPSTSTAHTKSPRSDNYTHKDKDKQDNTKKDKDKVDKDKKDKDKDKKAKNKDKKDKDKDKKDKNKDKKDKDKDRKDKDRDKKDKDKDKKDKDTDKDKKHKDTDKDKKHKETDKDKKYKDTDKDKKHKDSEKDKAENSSDDNDDFVYMSDDYRGSDHETENSQMSCETAGDKVGGEGKKTPTPKRNDAVEKNAVMGKIFKNNAVRSDKKSPKAREPAKPKANLDQLFDSLLQEEPSTSTANQEEQSSKIEDDENLEESHVRFDQLASSQDDIKSLSSDDLSSSLNSPCHFDQPSTSQNYKTPSPRNETVSTSPVPFDIYGPSTSKAYDEYFYGPSTSKQYDVRPSKDYKSKYDLSKNSARDESSDSASSSEYKVPTPTEDSDSSKKKKQKLSKERSNRVNEGASTSYDIDASQDSGVARQRERRKCTEGKQNVLAETWSSESEPDGTPPRPRSSESVLSGVTRKKKGKKKEGHHSRRGKRKQESESRVTSSSNNAGGDGEVVRSGGGGCPAPASAVAPIVPVAGPSGVARPRARAASFWSSDGEEEHVQQHGWIVGDSHKKLVTMLAHAKGRKRNTDDKRDFE